MSWININNEESGSSIRTKINNAMNALFGNLPVVQLWEAVTGADRIKPTDSNGIETPELVIPELGGFGAGTTKMVVIDNDGKLDTNDSDLLLFSDLLGTRAFGIPGEQYINFHADYTEIYDSTTDGFIVTSGKISLTDSLIIYKDGIKGTISDPTNNCKISLDDQDIIISVDNELYIKIDGTTYLNCNTAYGVDFYQGVSFRKIPRYSSAANIITNISTSQTLSGTDAGKYFRHTGASNIELSVPESLAWGNGESIEVRRSAAGNVKIVGATGNVIINPAEPATTSLHDTIKLIKVSSLEYDAIVMSA